MTTKRRRTGARHAKLTPLQNELLDRAIARSQLHTAVRKKPKLRDVRARQERLVRDILSGAVAPFASPVEALAQPDTNTP